MRRGQIGHDVGCDLASRELRENVGGVAQNAEGGARRALSRGLARLQRRVELGEHGGQVAALVAALQLGRVDLDDQRDRVQHADGDRLSAAHAAQSRGEDEAAGQRSAEVLARDRAQHLIAALQHTLRADVLPVAGGQPAPHRESLVGEGIEVLRGRVVADDVAVRHDHDRRERLRGEDPDRLARLDDQRLAVADCFECRDQAVERGPVPGRLRK